jgi:CheY-like chemotaxis protein
MTNVLHTILLVDDDEISNYITEALIKEINMAKELSIATDGQQALDFLKQHPVINQKEQGHILILLDLNMPVMDGFEFMEECRKQSWKDKVTVIMLTSSSNPKDISRAKDYAFAGYLQKPFSQEELKEIIKAQNLP